MACPGATTSADLRAVPAVIGLHTAELRHISSCNAQSGFGSNYWISVVVFHYNHFICFYIFFAPVLLKWKADSRELPEVNWPRFSLRGCCATRIFGDFLSRKELLFRE